MPGKIARSPPRPPFGLAEVPVTVGTSRLSCGNAGKARILTPVWESSGESRLKGVPTAHIVDGQPIEDIVTPVIAKYEEWFADPKH